MSNKKIQYACAISGNLCALLFIIALAASGFLPPLPPDWDAVQVVDHYHDHENGIRAGAALLVVSGMFYLPMTAAISDQIRQITGIYDAVRNIQLAAGAAGAFAIVMPGVTLAVASYRLDRPIETTQLLNDLFWMLLLIPWPIFMAQSFSLAYAILVDSRAKPPFPKPIALVNILVPITYIPSIAVHCVKTGPVAWNGVVSFWIPIISFGIQVMVDCTCLMRAAAAADMQAY